MTGQDLTDESRLHDKSKPDERVWSSLQDKTERISQDFMTSQDKKKESGPYDRTRLDGLAKPS